MAKRKRQSRGPQPQHKKSPASRPDKRARLGRPNRERRHTTRAKIPLWGALSAAVVAMAGVLDRRIAFRLAIIVAGMLLADDRPAASAWFVAAGVPDDWDRFYDCLISSGRKSRPIATVVLGLVVRKFAPGPGSRILVGLDLCLLPVLWPEADAALRPSRRGRRSASPSDTRTRRRRVAVRA